MKKISFEENKIESQMCSILSSVLKRVLPEIEANALEYRQLSEFYLFGVDFMLDSKGMVKLLEFNARPSIKIIMKMTPRLVHEMADIVLDIGRDLKKVKFSKPTNFKQLQI